MRRNLIITAAAALALIVPATASAAAPAAGSCVNPSGVATDANVSYHWTSRAGSWRVRPALATLVARTRPGAGGKAGVVSQRTVHTGVQAWYLVLDAKQVGAKCWLRLRLPAEPTSRGGWVDRDLLLAQKLAWQIEVDLSDRKVRVYQGAVLKLAKGVVIGASATPTPLTMPNEPFAMYDAKRGAATDFTGSWQLATTARSAVDPGLGRIGIHGRGGASLTQALGTAASHGCVRSDNATVDAMVRMMGLQGMLGAPMLVVA